MARIKLDVAAGGDLKNVLTSFIGRELRSLPGVVLVDEQPDRILNIVGLVATRQGGMSIGFAIGIVTGVPLGPQMFALDCR